MDAVTNTLAWAITLLLIVAFVVAWLLASAFVRLAALLSALLAMAAADRGWDYGLAYREVLHSLETRR